MDENLIKLEHFFSVDIKIKKEMLQLCPPDKYLDEESIIEYLDKAFDSLKYIFTELKCVGLDFLGMEMVKKISLLEEKTIQAFIYCKTDIEKLKKAYRLFISEMATEFINTVKAECIGYTPYEITESFNKVSTVNEFLHLIHSYIINNEKILQSVPKVGEKNNNYEYPIILRGNSNEYFNQLFQNFPVDLRCGWSEMVAINENKLLIMIRDRGHALTIEVTVDKNIARMEYFIPKLCNTEMINSLPGINKVGEGSVGATGAVEVGKEQLSQTLYDFISRVPMDTDMEIYKSLR